MDPAAQTGQEMTEQEAASYLAANDTGVLSLASENSGYGFPISYTYEEGNDRIVLGFAPLSGSKKRAFVTATEEATFTVYTYTDVDSWRSVIATGAIQPVDGEADGLAVPDLFFRRDSDATDADEQLVDLDAYDRTWYELQIDTLSGRHSG